MCGWSTPLATPMPFALVSLSDFSARLAPSSIVAASSRPGPGLAPVTSFFCLFLSFLGISRVLLCADGFAVCRLASRPQSQFPRSNRTPPAECPIQFCHRPETRYALRLVRHCLCYSPATSRAFRLLAPGRSRS